MLDLDGIRERQQIALAQKIDSPALRQIVLDDVPALMREIEEMRGNPSDESEEYSVFRKLKSGEVKEYRYRRKRWYEDGKQKVEHVPVRTAKG